MILVLTAVNFSKPVLRKCFGCICRCWLRTDRRELAASAVCCWVHLLYAVYAESKSKEKTTQTGYIFCADGFIY